ncbi:variable large family protein [Borreliella afzelii]|uniref:variable large family protein n=1 Tax=Borreliella afzelii TaxID=29518 RepID=UPI003AF96226
MITAADGAAKGGTGGNSEKIGDAGDNNNGAKADENSVKEIANGIKGIVAAAGKAFGKDGKDGNALKDVAAAAADDEANKDAGKLFAGNGAAGAAVGDIAKAAGAVSAVSGEQILKAIVEAAGAADQAGKKADAAKNPIEAAIGADDGAAAFGEEMKKSDKIAAAIVLRGVAKDGKFAVAANDGKKASVKSAVESAVDEVSNWLEEMITAAGEAAKVGDGEANEKIGDVGADNKGAVADANSVKEIANGIKGIVDAAGKAFGKDGALKDVAAAAENDDKKEAGKLFAGNAAGNAAAAEIAKAAGAVTAVSGEQILKAIVEAAGAADQAGVKADAAKNPIEAAIGTNEAGAEFGDDMKKRNDKIAAAIVLRGVAKDGKFAVANAAADNSKASVKSAVDEVSKWLEEMIKAAGEAATKGGTGEASEKIGDVGAANNKGAKADASSVKEIANGIKGIVDAAGKAFGKDGALKDVKTVAAENEANKDAGKLFAGKNGNAAAAAADIAKAAAAVTAVSGEQILKAIVDAAGAADQAGAAAGAATNPIEAAIGTDNDGAAFNEN